MNSNYPDPEQLEAYAEEPYPFHDIWGKDLELIEDEYIRVGYGNVEYRFCPTYINVETAPGEWKRVQDVSYYDMTHTDAFNRAIEFQIEEDFICATEFVTDSEGEPAQFEAYWILETVTFENPNLRN